MRITNAERERRAYRMGVMICTFAGLGFGFSESFIVFAIGLVLILFGCFLAYQSAALEDEDEYI